MKSRIAAFIFATGTFFFASDFFAPEAIAQENAGCFMVGLDGEIVRLDDLCDGEIIEIPEGTSEPTGEPGLFQAPIKRREAGIPVLEVTFNGDRTFEMLLDTGASLTVLTERVARELELEPTGTILIQTPSDASTEFEIADLASISVGGIVREGLQVAIAPSLDIGLLGQDFFSDYDLTIKTDTIEFRVRESQNASL